MRFIVLIILLASCAPKAYKLTPPKTDRERHVFKYTDLYIAAQLSGKTDSANYYLNIALKYDSVLVAELRNSLTTYKGGLGVIKPDSKDEKGKLIERGFMDEPLDSIFFRSIDTIGRKVVKKKKI